MKEFGVSANLMSLGALDFGLIVDASVVMVENFVRRLEHAGDITPDARLLIRSAAHEVGRPIVFGVCIIIAVYLPIFTLEGPRERLRQPLGRLHRDVMTASHRPSEARPGQCGVAVVWRAARHRVEEGPE